MDKIHPGHDILSVLCPPLKARNRTIGALTDRILSKGLLVSIVSAFLIVLTVAFALQLTSVALEQKVSLSAAQAQVEHKVGWLPGQYIAPEISSGYIGRQ